MAGAYDFGCFFPVVTKWYRVQLPCVGEQVVVPGTFRLFHSAFSDDHYLSRLILLSLSCLNCKI